MLKVVQILRASIAGGLFMAATLAYALDGSNNVFATVPSGSGTGWKTFEIITGGDDLSTVTVGNDFSSTWTNKHTKWDGLGAYLYDANTLRLFINHENGTGSSFSRLDLNVPALKAWILAGSPDNTNSNQVPAASAVVDTISRGWQTVGSGTDPLNNPCSGNAWLADTFGAGLGFADNVYMLGEETFDDTGHIWVMDLATRTLYEASDLSSASWENATVIDTGRTDTIAIMLSEDLGDSVAGTSPIVLYVGEKDPISSSFLARNGLVGGNLYYWHADSGETNGTMSGLFSGGNGTIVSGSWKSAKAGAVLISKSEDIHTNMNRDSEGYGVEVALASQWEAVFLIDCSDLSFVVGDLSTTDRDCPVQVLYGESTNSQSPTYLLDAMDNLVWSPNGTIYVNEDDSTGALWAIEVDSLLASYAGGDFTPDANQVYNILDATTVSETSGVIDISDALDYVSGSIFLINGQDEVLTHNQLALCVAPTAQLKSDVYENWALSFPGLDTVAKRLPNADPDADSYDNATEFALGLTPDVPESAAPYAVASLVSSAQISFNAARSLDLVDYFVDYTSDLSAGFSDTIAIRAADVAANGDVQLSLPKTDQCFARIRAVLP